VPSDSEAAIQKIAQSVEVLFKKMGVAPKPIRDLQRESDWAFIVKLHSLLEASVNHLLVSHFGDERLEDAIVAMEMGDDRKGKAAFLKALKLLPPSSQSFIAKIGRIRNRLAHKIKDLDFNLATYLAMMGTDHRNALAGAMQEEMPKVKMHELLDSDPRKAFFAVFCVILYKIESGISSQRIATSTDEGRDVESRLASRIQGQGTRTSKSIKSP
jgi:hypothetical protein